MEALVLALENLALSSVEPAASLAIKVFCEADIRSHLAFQVSKLADALLKQNRTQLRLPPWDTVVPGKAEGKAVVLAGLSQSPTSDGRTIAIVQRAEGDEEIPPNV